MGATFLEVPIDEDGSGTGGYAKEMSDNYKKAQAQMMLEQAEDVDIIITTALIPGRKAPVLVDESMLSVMKSGSVCVDLAAENGGNVAMTQPNKIVTTENGVKIVGRVYGTPLMYLTYLFWLPKLSVSLDVPINCSIYITIFLCFFFAGIQIYLRD